MCLQNIGLEVRTNNDSDRNSLLSWSLSQLQIILFPHIQSKKVIIKNPSNVTLKNF